ncbi:MAG: hypothetical protein U1A78_00135 [Polyangia bacterium]
MVRNEQVTCPYCQARFASIAALERHAPHCPRGQSKEAERVIEALQWKKGRIAQTINECYRTAARTFHSYHTGALTYARLFHGHVETEVETIRSDLAALLQAVEQAHKTHFPYLSKTKREVEELIPQSKDLESILSTLDGEYGRTN